MELVVVLVVSKHDDCINDNLNKQCLSLTLLFDCVLEAWKLLI